MSDRLKYSGLQDDSAFSTASLFSPAPPSSASRWSLNAPVDTTIGGALPTSGSAFTNPSVVTPINGATQPPPSPPDPLAVTHMPDPTHMADPTHMPSPTQMATPGQMAAPTHMAAPDPDKLNKWRQQFGWGGASQ